MNIEEIEERISKVTPGPWEFILVDNVLITNNKDHKDACEIAENFGHVYDAEFIAKSPEYVQFLLSTIKSQRETLDKAHVLLDKYESLIDVDVVAERDKYREALIAAEEYIREAEQSFEWERGPCRSWEEMLEEKAVHKAWYTVQSALKEE